MQIRGTLLALLSGAALCAATPALALGPGATIATGDMDGDGVSDIVALEPDVSQVDIVCMDPHGDFTLLPTQVFTDIPAMSSVSVADLNGDGIQDVIISDGSSAAAGVRVLFNDGHGVLSPDVAYASEAGGGKGPVSVTSADLDGDGFPDLVTANGSDGTVSVLRNDGDGTFAAPAAYAAGTDPVAVAVADVNGDGLPDLVVADLGSNSVQILLNDGDGTFAAPIAESVGAGPVAVALTDVDGDGKPDVVVVDRDDDTAGILIGNGDGSFAPVQFVSTGAQPGWLASRDLDGDGRPDLVTANYSDGSISVFTNTGSGFVPAKTVFPAYGSYDTLVMDIGGKPQLVSTNVPAGTVVVIPASAPAQGVGDPPKTTVHHINGAQDPQSSNGSGDFGLLSLMLIGLARLSRRGACRRP
ncbi:MAG TPA: VCBS repeat-containing protein [Gammaproteobacteria bacterium]